LRSINPFKQLDSTFDFIELGFRSGIGAIYGHIRRLKIPVGEGNTVSDDKEADF